MGSNTSKLTENLNEYYSSTCENYSQPEETGSIPTTPVLTPKASHEEVREQHMDPRSPSKQIARTPIEVLSSAALKFTDLTIESSETDRPNIETPLKHHLILGIDPRSPSIGVQRTPIVVSASPDKKFPAIVKNKNLEKIKNSVLLNSSIAGVATPKQVSPKLLSSHLATPKIAKSDDAYKRKSFVLLETNIDFTETDLDVVIQEKYSGKDRVCSMEEVDDKKETQEGLEEMNDEIKESFTTETQESSMETGPVDIENEENKEQNVEEVLVVQTVEHYVEVTDSNLLKDIIGEQSISKEMNEDQGMDSKDVLKETDTMQPHQNQMELRPEIQHELTTHTLSFTPEKSAPASPRLKMDLELTTRIHSPPNLITSKAAPMFSPTPYSISPQKSKSEPVTSPIINLTADVNELDKKLTNLIYEDEDPIVCPRAVKSIDQCRTPLGLRNGEEVKKSNVQKLKVSDKPRKQVKMGSKIPIFKDKKVKVQCENTPPPRNIRNIGNSKKTHWDPKDETLFI
ncbi:cell division cycle-associated protein 3-like [Euwallacea similis]|uniref:cell division cycle-associated protein 3-like n=1 Tax=Euwallacea similis TaxID=1736056 RepID=UPI00344BF39F